MCVLSLLSDNTGVTLHCQYSVQWYLLTDRMHSLFRACFLKMSNILQPAGRKSLFNYRCRFLFTGADDSTFFAIQYINLQSGKTCHSVHVIIFFFLSSPGGVSVCSQHRGPWDILYRLLRVSLSILYVLKCVKYSQSCVPAAILMKNRNIILFACTVFIILSQYILYLNDGYVCVLLYYVQYLKRKHIFTPPHGLWRSNVHTYYMDINLRILI